MNRSGCLWGIVIVVVVLFLFSHGNTSSYEQSSSAANTQGSYTNEQSSNTTTITTGQNSNNTTIQNPAQPAQSFPTDVVSTTYDSLPDTNYYCNRIHFLGGNFPKHFYVGHCIIQNVVQYSWTVKAIATIISNTLCQENFGCSTIVGKLASFIKYEIDHLNDEDNQCGQSGIYVHWFDVFFRTHPVC